MDPEVLQHKLSLPNSAKLTSACVSGWRIKMGGPYPILLPAPSDSLVKGQLFQLESEEQLDKTFWYEGSSCKLTDLEIKLLDGATVAGKAFMWASDPESEELHDGKFDLDAYCRVLKPLAMGKSTGFVG